MVLGDAGVIERDVVGRAQAAVVGGLDEAGEVVDEVEAEVVGESVALVALGALPCCCCLLAFATLMLQGMKTFFTVQATVAATVDIRLFRLF